MFQPTHSSARSHGAFKAATARLRTASALTLAFACLAFAACSSEKKPDDHKIGATEFTTLEQGAGSPQSIGRGGLANDATAAPTAGGNAGGTSKGPESGPAPSGRTADVEEADIYKMVGTKLLYLNTYRGLTIYDVADPTKPTQISRLPVYGYPIEMFVEGNTVYALLREALYLTQIEGKVQFQKHNVSQLVTVDITDPTKPRVLKTLDIIGQLHEGVSRKIENTIYVVSEQYGYYWGWYSREAVAAKNQAWVYSFDVSNPTDTRLAGQLQVFEGGDFNNYDPATGANSSRYFSGVAISATSNALMVVENWYDYASAGRGGGSSGCGDYTNSQEAIVSLVDISDATGKIRLHTKFKTQGSLSDQFKMTYVPDTTAKTGTFYGIFSQQSWTTCTGSTTQNTLESWDVTDGTHPAKLAALSFGKPNETVAATSFDLKRNLAYAITARQIDPIYAIDISNRNAPKILSAIDGLSGSVSVFRQVADGQFLLGVGQDQSATCAGQMDGDGWQNTKMALSVIDVRDPTKIKLAQRKCINIKNAGWSWSQLTWNLDQAHKMLGMFEDGTTNIMTVPVSYESKEELSSNFGWWYHWQTAVGLLTWDLSLYDPAKAPADQKIIQSYGTFIHPQGEVQRSILFRHPTTGNRTMINLSATHLSVANIQDLNAPTLQSVVEVAPEISGIYGFGDYLVERVEVGNGQWYSWDRELSEFRVKKAGGPVDDRAPVAIFQVGQVSSVHRYDNNLVVMRRVLDDVSKTYSTEAVIFDLSNPAAPKAAGRITVPFDPYSYYGFYCGVDSFFWGYWFGSYQSLLTTNSGLVQLRTVYGAQNGGNYYTYDQILTFLDLRNPASPKLVEKKMGTYDSRTSIGWWDSMGLVADAVSPSGFYVTRRTPLETIKMPNGEMFTRFAYFAQRFETNDGTLAGGDEVNLPGPLTQTWKDGNGSRFFLTQNNEYRTITFPDHNEWHADTNVSLLREVSSTKAELLDHRVFTDVNLSSMVVDGTRLYVVGQQQYYWWSYDALRANNPPSWESTSDRLMIFDTAAGKLKSLYDQATRTYGVQLMGTHEGKLFVNVPGDGMLMADVSNPAAPQGQKFLRTLGYASSLEFAGNDAYQSSGNFGVFNMNLRTPGTLPREVLTTGP